MSELAFSSALGQAELVRSREVSPLELVELYLERIERIDPQLNAFVTVDADGARAAAERSGDGPFHGVPITIKDLHDTAGIRTTYSSRAFADNVPTADMAVVRRLRDAGFVVLGKTNTPELGTIGVTESELNGACRNPWDLSRTPGGSSGGAAAAVAAGLCPVAQGSDGGGSIRNPSSCCGLFGLKPSRGRVSPAPFGSGALGLATSGPIARTVADAAALLDAMAGYEPGDAYMLPSPRRPFAQSVGDDPGRLRVAFTLEAPVAVPVDPACADAARAAAALLSELGHDVVEGAPPWRADDVVSAFTAVWQLSPAISGAPLDALEPLNRALAENAHATSSVDVALAVSRLQTYARAVVAFWSDVDVVLTPTLALPPVPVGWSFEGSDDPLEHFARQILFTPFTPVVNVTGQPAVSVPFGERDGLPIGVQLIGPPAGEELLLRLSAQLERARPWAERRPPLAR